MAADGTQFSWRWNGATISQNLGVIREMSGETKKQLVQEVAELKRAEGTLRDSEEMHRSIIETASEGYIETDAEARLIEVNDSFCAMLGYQRQELLGKSFFSLSG